VDLDVPIKRIDLPSNVYSYILNVMAYLKLKMGIFDLKVNVNGEIFWLEVNPQGQFLFLEGLTGIDLTTPFRDFLYAEAIQAKN
jgi:hypothetical protein